MGCCGAKTTSADARVKPKKSEGKNNIFIKSAEPSYNGDSPTSSQLPFGNPKLMQMPSSDRNLSKAVTFGNVENPNAEDRLPPFHSSKLDTPKSDHKVAESPYFGEPAKCFDFDKKLTEPFEGERTTSPEGDSSLQLQQPKNQLTFESFKLQKVEMSDIEFQALNGMQSPDSPLHRLLADNSEVPHFDKKGSTQSLQKLMYIIEQDNESGRSSPNYKKDQNSQVQSSISSAHPTPQPSPQPQQFISIRDVQTEKEDERRRIEGFEEAQARSRVKIINKDKTGRVNIIRPRFSNNERQATDVELERKSPYIPGLEADSPTSKTLNLNSSPNNFESKPSSGEQSSSILPQENLLANMNQERTPEQMNLKRIKFDNSDPPQLPLIRKSSNDKKSAPNLNTVTAVTNPTAERVCETQRYGQTIGLSVSKSPVSRGSIKTAPKVFRTYSKVNLLELAAKKLAAPKKEEQFLVTKGYRSPGKRPTKSFHSVMLEPNLSPTNRKNSETSILQDDQDDFNKLSQKDISALNFSVQDANKDSKDSRDSIGEIPSKKPKRKRRLESFMIDPDHSKKHAKDGEVRKQSLFANKSFNLNESRDEFNEKLNTSYIKKKENLTPKVSMQQHGFKIEGMRTKINDYVLIKTIGKGGWTEDVFLGVNITTKELFVI